LNAGTEGQKWVQGNLRFSNILRNPEEFEEEHDIIHDEVGRTKGPGG